MPVENDNVYKSSYSLLSSLKVDNQVMYLIITEKSYKPNPFKNNTI